MGTPNTEAILNKVKTLCSAIVGVGSVKVNEDIPHNLADSGLTFPAVFIMGGDPEVESRNFGRTYYTFPVMVSLIRSGSDASSLETREGQVVAAVMSDKRQGGNALDTEVVRSARDMTWDDPKNKQKVDVEFSVYYWTARESI